ncbi:LysR family transcriptional regulator [Jeotgalibaca ciconiae]|uniref:LysR family transcriptional regulator n=1 Tax=Jeotgalibaca ciconiae TaxID=2496265 RepID=A0A3S9HD12_9LACT|nr:LysR family transcriptional regulator [Jeotgalibaca ciconiae]AZP05043.1 LysR family transcriptional regulator [Jeotgalibaca ciconiae]HJB24451.1 LysR family transcriptional regulator [Candidatus Jeotgalibaca pullicola]
MNLQDLVYFHHLARSLSFTATAEHFFISQPSISMALKRLESELDTILIDRRKVLKRMVLTPAGDLLYKSADEIIKTLDTTKRLIRDIEQESVYYGFLPTIGGHFLPKILPKIVRFTKSLKLIEEESSDVMLKLILEEKVPIAIIGHETPFILQNKIKQIQLLEEEMSLWVSKTHHLAGSKSVSAEEIQEEVFISLSEGYTHQRVFEKWANEYRIKEPNIVYAKEIKTVQSIAASTHMVAFMSDILLGNRSDLVKVPLKKAPKFYISLVINTEAKNTYIQQQFNDAVIEIVQNGF